jgi:hypothetical protein
MKKRRCKHKNEKVMRQQMMLMVHEFPHHKDSGDEVLRTENEVMVTVVGCDDCGELLRATYAGFDKSGDLDPAYAMARLAAVNEKLLARREQHWSNRLLAVCNSVIDDSVYCRYKGGTGEACVLVPERLIREAVKARDAANHVKAAEDSDGHTG